MFWAPCGSGGEGGWVDGGVGWLGGAPHTHAHACTCTHAHAHACMVNMIIPCKWPPPLDLGKSQGFPMMSYMHMRVRVHVGGVHPLTTPHPHPPTPHPPRVGTPRISQNSIALELIEIFQFCLKIWNLWVYNFMGGWVGGWVDGWGQVKSLKI